MGQLFSFIILLTSIFTFFFFGEIRNLTTFTRLMDYNNGFSLSSFFLSLLSFLWIGAQFPQEKFLSYGRILTLHYYFLLMCILFSFFIFIIWVLFLFFILYLYCYKRLLFPLDKSLISYLQSLFIIFHYSSRYYSLFSWIYFYLQIICWHRLMNPRIVIQRNTTAGIWPSSDSCSSNQWSVSRWMYRWLLVRRLAFCFINHLS